MDYAEQEAARIFIDPEGYLIDFFDPSSAQWATEEERCHCRDYFFWECTMELARRKDVYLEEAQRDTVPPNLPIPFEKPRAPGRRSVM